MTKFLSLSSHKCSEWIHIACQIPLSVEVRDIIPYIGRDHTVRKYLIIIHERCQQMIFVFYCMGGNPLFAFGYIFLNGLVAESAYPLNYGIDQNRERETCRRFGPVPPAVAHIGAFAAVRR